jgi:hypothetical protein
MHVGLRFALRGAGCFALGGAVAGAGQWLALRDGGAEPEPAFRMMPLLLALNFLGGAAASALFGYRQCLSMHRLRPLTGFGLGFMLATLIMLETMSQLHGGGALTLHTALMLGAGFGLAGGLGGFGLDPEYLLPGLLSFGLVGAVGGPLLLCALAHPSVSTAGLPGLLTQATGSALLFAAAGALFGAFVR